MLFSVFLLALRSIRRNLLRSFLTILGIVIGVSAVITMVTLGNGATQSIQTQITSLGTNLLMVMPGQRQPGGGGGGGGGVPQFTEADAEAIASADRRRGRRWRRRGAPVSPWWPTAATGPPRSPAAPTPGSTPATGSWPAAAIFEPDEQQGRRGLHHRRDGAARDLRRHGRPAPGLGEQLRIKQFSCDVVGILAAKGQGGMGDQDDTVVVPLRTLQRRVTGSRKVSMLSVSMEDGMPTARR
jgi:putative ABC transport system permease protein